MLVGWDTLWHVGPVSSSPTPHSEGLLGAALGAAGCQPRPSAHPVAEYLRSPLGHPQERPTLSRCCLKASSLPVLHLDPHLC